LPPSMLDWLPEDHLVWFVIAAVQRLDCSRFHERARLGGVGRRGYDPQMLLTLFVYAMAHGESSSRRIERLCHTDVAFRLICASDAPDHTVLARFRAHHQRALGDLLTESLAVAAELGMVRLGVVAFDGTKIAANASREANRSEEHLAKLAEEFLGTLGATDAAEDLLFGAGARGDELPVGVGDRTRRGERITAALAQVRTRRDAAEAARREQAGRERAYEQAAEASAAPGAVMRPGRPPRNADVVTVTQARLNRRRARAQARHDEWAARAGRTRAQGRVPSGRPPVPVEDQRGVRAARAAYQAARAEAAERAVDQAHSGETGSEGPAGRTDRTEGAEGAERLNVNLTDPDSRLLKTRNGWVQGYNCQTAVSQDEFIVSARATQDANDVEQFVPTVDDLTATAERLAARTGREDLTVGTMVGDAGYDSQTNLDAAGPDRLIADAKRHLIDQRAAAEPATGDPPAGASARQKMNHRLRTPEGHSLYKRRAPTVEGPNAWLKDRRGLRRFARRGLAAAQAELSFACAVTNLLKLATKGVTATRLQTG